jgi:CRP-like cAMP-binding protein
MKSKTVLAGNLDFLSLADVLQLLGANGGSGVLRISSPYSNEQGHIYIVNGNPANASCGSLTGIDAVYTLFGWTEGEFDFTRDRLDIAKVIKKSRMEIILDGLRMLDDGLIKKLGPASFEKISLDSSGTFTMVPIIKGPLVDYMYVVDEEEFIEGQQIVQEGKHGGWIWVILEGTVDIIKETPQGPLTILRLTDGSFIGSIATFLMQSNARSASVRAASNVQLGVLDSQRLAKEFARISSEFRAFVLSLNKRLIQVTEWATGLWQKNNTLEAFIKGRTPLIQQGENEDKLFTILQGEAFVVRKTDDGYVPLATLYDGDFFGRVPFLDMGHEPYSASVFASENLKVSLMESDKLQEEHERLSTTFKNIIKNTATCISITTRVACEFQTKIVLDRQKNISG